MNHFVLKMNEIAEDKDLRWKKDCK